MLLCANVCTMSTMKLIRLIIFVVDSHFRSAKDF